MAKFTGCWGFCGALGVSASLLACGSRYEVGHSAGGSAPLIQGGSLAEGGANQETESGGRATTGGRASTGGADATGAGAQGGVSTGAGAVTGVGAAASTGAVTGAGAVTGFPACLQSAPQPQAFELAEPSEIWRRLTAFLYGESFPAPANLPSATSFGWIRETASKMLYGELAAEELPEGPAPVFQNLIGSWLGDPEAAARYAAPLSAADARLESLWWAPDPEEPHRIGLLTDHSLLTEHPSISARGRWFSEYLLCRQVPPPPPSITLPTPPDEPGKTRREELEYSLSEPVCASCHRILDQPGFSLEHFDELGEYRTEDDGKPIDASGEILLTSDMMYSEVLRFTDVEELAPQLATSCFVNQCFARQVWVDAVQRSRGPARAEQELPREVDLVFSRFADDSYSIATLIEAVVTSPSFAGMQ